MPLEFKIRKVHWIIGITIESTKEIGFGQYFKEWERSKG